MRDLFAEVLGVRAGRRRRQLLRPRRPLAAGHPAGQSRSAPTLGVELPLRACSRRRPSPASPALSATQRGGAPAAADRRRPTRDRALPLSFAQQRLWFLDRLEPAPARPTTSRSALRLRGRSTSRRCSAALRRRGRPPRGAAHRLRRRGRRARTSVDPAGRSRSAPSCTVPRSREAGLAARRPRRRRAVRPGRRDRRSGPGCSRSAPSDHVLLLVLHHIAGDGWSMGVAGPRPGQRSTPPAARARPRRWRRCRCSTPTTRSGSARLLGARRPGQRRRRSSRTGGAALAGLPEAAGAADRPPAARRAQPTAAAAVTFQLDAELHRGAARRWPASTGRTLFMVLQAGLAALLSRLGAGTTSVGTADRRPQRRRRWTTWSASSSTPWCCAPTCPATRLRRAAGPGPGDRPGRVRPPGRAVRAAGRGAQPGARRGRTTRCSR